MEKFNRIVCGISVEERDLQCHRNAALMACPLRDGNCCTAFLAPGSRNGLREFVAVADRMGVYPAKGFYDPERDRWLYLDRENKCLPCRTEAVQIIIEGWVQDGIVKLARWCRNRAFEHAWIAAAIACHDVDRARRIANFAIDNAIHAAENANRAIRDPAEAALDAAHAAFLTARAARNVACIAGTGNDAAEITRWNAIFEWIAEYDKKYRKKDGFE